MTPNLIARLRTSLRCAQTLLEAVKSTASRQKYLNNLVINTFFLRFGDKITKKEVTLQQIPKKNEF